MSLQIKASFKKELLAFFRTKRFWIIALVIIGLSVFSPLLITGMGALVDMMSDLYEEFGMDVSMLTEALGSSSSIGVSSSISDITGAGLIVMLLLLNSAAGGEQKKRSVIIPRSAGLQSTAYIFPKFIIYPLSAFVLAIIAMMISYPVSVYVFEVNDVTFFRVILAGVLSGVYLMFYTCFHLTLGTATGIAGMSAAVCISASIILSNIFAFIGTDYMFNPFSLNLMATSMLFNDPTSGVKALDVVATVVFALGIMVLLYFIAVFAQNARRIDNSGNEIDL